MSRILLLFLCCLSFWWVSCQNTPAEKPAEALTDAPFSLPSLGVQSIEPATPDANITVQVNGLGAGTAKLVGISGDQNYIIDTTLVDAGGTLRFQRDPAYPPGFYYIILPDFSNIQLILDANQHFTLSTTAGNLIQAMEIKGSKENELFYSNLRFQQPIDQQLKNLTTAQKNRGAGTPEFDQMKKEIDSLVAVRKAHILSFASEYPKAFFTKFKLSGQNPDLTYPKNPDGSVDVALQTFTYREGLWDNVDFSDPRLLRTPVVNNKLMRYIKELTPQMPDSIIFSADRLLAKVANHPEYFKFFANVIPLTYKPGESTLMDAEAVQVHMVKHYFTKEKAFWASEEDLRALQKQSSEMEASLIGKPAPDVQARDVNGVMRSIGEIKSPYVIVFMWNPECSHCREETPKLIEFMKEWKPKGVEVFGISVNTTEPEYKRKVKEYGMTWTNVFDPTNRAIYAKYYVDNTPEIYVLNPERTIIGKNLKVNQIATIIERDMNKRKQ